MKKYKSKAPIDLFSRIFYYFYIVYHLIEIIETLHAIATGNLTRGSVERVKDCCAKSDVLSDCIQKLGGICTYDDYPTARNVCEPNACKPFT